MQDPLDQDRIDALRERLYSRGEGVKPRKTTLLHDDIKPVPTSWNRPNGQSHEPVTATAQIPHAQSTPVADTTLPVAVEPMKNKRKQYRMKLLLAGIFFFVAAVTLSSLFLLFGANSISGENISISITGPFTVGGGEVIPLQVGVTNQNSVPIQSATLIIEYPAGTQSPDEESKELFVERLSLETIESGQTVNIPLKAQVYGEENDELIIRASVEYRVKGSNATFFKEAEPLRFKISSSPIVVNVNAVKNISSGQETDVVLTISSNAATRLTNILVKAEYPNGFDYTSSSPAPMSGQNIWMIDELDPEGSATIEIKGSLLGSESEEFAMNFSVGVPNERDRLSLASIFALVSTEFTIEEAFLDVGVLVNGVKNSVSSISPGDQSSVSVQIENTLSDSIYDGVVELSLSGNALSGAEILVSDGYYDTNQQKIVWDISSAPQLEQIVPGEGATFSFSIKPASGSVRTPQLNLEAAVRARRVSESQVQEEIVGTVKSTIKIESDVKLSAQADYNTGSFNDVGPVPPLVGQVTSYTINWASANTSNKVSNLVTTATLPSYVTWLGKTDGSGTLAYNPATREITWQVSSLEAGAAAVGSFQVSILPSASQIDTTPTLVSDIRLKAEDDFTGTTIRSTHPAITTRLSADSGYDRDSGTVQQ